MNSCSKSNITDSTVCLHLSYSMFVKSKKYIIFSAGFVEIAKCLSTVLLSNNSVFVSETNSLLSALKSATKSVVTRGQETSVLTWLYFEPLHCRYL